MPILRESWLQNLSFVFGVAVFMFTVVIGVGLLVGLAPTGTVRKPPSCGKR